MNTRDNIRDFDAETAVLNSVKLEKPEETIFSGFFVRNSIIFSSIFLIITGFRFNAILGNTEK